MLSLAKNSNWLSLEYILSRFILNLSHSKKCKKKKNVKKKKTYKINSLLKEVGINYLFCLHIIVNNVISLVKQINNSISPVYSLYIEKGNLHSQK